MKIYCMVTDTGLTPMYESDWEEFKKLKRGAPIVVDPKKARNYEFHKKFWALMRLTFDNLNETLQEHLQVSTVEDLAVRLKIDLKLFTLVPYGNMCAISVNSISFDAMDEYEFIEFYNKCVNHILNIYLKGVSSDQINEELFRFL